jgi:Mn-dependent DtxR family transcriptional regulator
MAKKTETEATETTAQPAPIVTLTPEGDARVQQLRGKFTELRAFLANRVPSQDARSLAEVAIDNACDLAVAAVSADTTFTVTVPA